MCHYILFDRGSLLMVRTDSKKYPPEVSGGGKHSNSTLNDQINLMTKAEMMNKYFDSNKKGSSSAEICRVVKSIFGFDLDTMPVLSKRGEEGVEALSSDTFEIPVSRVLINSYLDQSGKEVTGAEIRNMINQIFGINLDAISSLDGARISLYSKDQWVVQHTKDLFVVQTGTGDVDVKVFPTEYFTEQTGLEQLPVDLHHSLTNIGFTYNEQIGSCYYSSPTGEAVPDAFKGQTIGAIMKAIHDAYSLL
jgi:hypothetical protein